MRQERSMSILWSCSKVDQRNIPCLPYISRKNQYRSCREELKPWCSFSFSRFCKGAAQAHFPKKLSCWVGEGRLPWFFPVPYRLVYHTYKAIRYCQLLIQNQKAVLLMGPWQIGGYINSNLNLKLGTDSTLHVEEIYPNSHISVLI